MKLLKCVVRPNALEKVKEALNGLGVTGMAVSEIQGFGSQKGPIDQLTTDHTTQSVKGTWRTYSLAEGLAGIQVEHIAEDRDGYLWFGTWDSGASRFDGDEFHTFSRISGLSGNQVMAIFLDSQDRLWFGTRDGGACWFDGQQFHHFNNNDGVSNSSIGYITEDRYGRVWFGGEGTLGYYEDQTFHNLYPEYLRSRNKPLAENDFRGCNGISMDEQGCVWLAFTTLSCYDGHSFRHFDSAAGLPESNYAYALNIDAQGDLWIGGNNTIGRFIDETFHPEPFSTGGIVRKIQTDRAGRTWFCTSGGGVISYDGGKFMRLTVQDGVAYDVINSVFTDREGHIWMGTWGGGASCWDPESIQVFGTEDGIPPEGPFTLLEDQHEHLWMGFAPIFSPLQKSIIRYDQQQRVSPQEDVDLGRCWALCDNDKGALYIGGERGLVCYDGERFDWPGQSHGLANIVVQSLTTDHQDKLIIGYLNNEDDTVQIAEYDGKNFNVLFKDTNSDPEDCITALIISRKDVLWFGLGTSTDKTKGRGIGYLRPGAGFRFLTSAEGLIDDRVEDLLEDRHGRLWIATLGGLSCFDGIGFKNFSTENGLPNNRIRCLYEDSKGYLWLGTDNGIARYDGQIFQTMHAPQLSSVTSICASRTGQFWFATLHHVIRYQPSSIPPRCRVSRIIADQIYQNINEIEITAEVRQVIFEFKSISFRTHPTNMHYYHRLLGYEEEWQESLNPTMSACYQELPPGDYSFEVRCIDRDFNRSEPAAVLLKVQPDPRFEILSENETLKKESLIGHSTALRRVLSQINEVAKTNLTILILGQTGTGKGLIARTVHRLSMRHDFPLIQVNCGALPSGLIESELFGHEKGAFTNAISRKPGKVELAQGGTLFLDEVGDLTLEAQVKLLNLLEEGTFERVGGTESLKANIRVIAATNRNLQQMVANGSFREDLYFRLQVFPLELPPLHHRREDIPQLANHFMKEMAAHLDKTVTHLHPEAINLLQAYDWPGNVRELEHVLQRAVIVCKESTILAPDIALVLPSLDPPQQLKPMTLEENERRHILAILEKTGWVVKGPDGAAKILNLPPSTLRSRMKKLGIERQGRHIVL